jgi:hypothetical protein
MDYVKKITQLALNCANLYNFLQLNNNSKNIFSLYPKGPMLAQPFSQKVE